MDLPEETVVLLEAYRRSHATQVLTLFLCDLEGSTNQQDALGNIEAAFWTKAYYACVRNVLAGFDGKEVETAGDSFLIVFSSPSDGVAFALRLQQALLQEREKTHLLPAVRMGLHQGQVVVEQHGGTARALSIYGLQLSIASRVMGLAAGGQILCTRHVFDDARAILSSDLLSGLNRLAWVNHGPYRLKGVTETYEVCEVGEERYAPWVKPAGSEKAQAVEADDLIAGWRPGQNVTLPMMNWVLERKLGEGGFGEVWLAHDGTSATRKTVFKFCTKRSKLSSLRRELSIFNRLAEEKGDSPVEIAEIRGAHDEGEPPYYLQMAYYAGGDLRQWIDAYGSVAGRKSTLAIALGMARAVAQLHNAGIVHRDIKPSNFLLDQPCNADKAPRLRISDFGTGQSVAQEALAGAAADETLYGGGTRYIVHSETLAQAAGTYLFIAPELILDAESRGNKASKLTLKSADIYSLGISFYQLFAGSTKQIPGVNLEGLENGVFRRVVLDCLQQDPGKRPVIDALIRRLEEQICRDEQGIKQFAEAQRQQEASAPNGTVVRTLELGNGVTLPLVWIPPGAFMMGSPEEEEGHKQNESPLHRVRIPSGFWMGRYAVTLEQWECVMGTTPSRFRKEKTLPVEQVSWIECKEFLGKLGMQTGLNFRLPTEAEWEYACRAGTDTPFYFGEALSTELANYHGDFKYGDGIPGENREKTLPVGSFPPNAWKLHDMHGNVWEFCEDTYCADFYAVSPLENPLCAQPGEERAVRGGAWYLAPVECRAAYRQGFPITGKNDGIGFRIVCRA